MQIVKPDTRIDFLGLRKFSTIFSGLLVLCSFVAFFAIGPNWGIDFTGGTEIHLKFQQPIEIAELRSAISALGLSDDAVQQVNAEEDYEFTVRVQDATFGADAIREEVEGILEGQFGEGWITNSRFDAQVGARMTVEHQPPEIPVRDLMNALSSMEGVKVQGAPDDNTFYVDFPGLTTQVQKLIATSLDGHAFEVLAVDSVGPKVGGDLRRQGFISMLATLGLVLLYVAFRFDLTFAPGAVLALFHDVIITIGIFVLIQREVNLSMIGALLTIIGYSLNDTIVIYDRIRENMDRYRRNDLPELINVSINETLNRTLNTSITTMMAIAAFLIWGGPVIRTFALAMLIGVFVGTYSTIFIASPMILVMDKIKPQLLKLMVPAGTPEPAEGEVAEGDSEPVAQEPGSWLQEPGRSE